MKICLNMSFPYLLRTVNFVAFIIIALAEEVAWQIYSPPWDVFTGLNSSVLMYTLLITWSVLFIGTSSEPIHWTVDSESPMRQSPSARVTVQVSENNSPAVGISYGGIVTVGGGTKGRNSSHYS